MAASAGGPVTPPSMADTGKDKWVLVEETE